MRKFMIAFLLMLAGGGLRAELVAGHGSSELRLYDSPCVHGATLAALKEEWRPKFHKAIGTVEGKTVFGCWIEAQEGVLYILMEGSDEGFMAPLSAFRDDPGI